MRVYYPSLDQGQDARILDQCEQFPLVLFSHGDCGGNPFVQWGFIAGQLARCGYVVAVVAFNAQFAQGDPAETAPLRNAETWLRTFWEHAGRVMPAPNTAVIGHSWGGTLAAKLATEIPLKAFVSLSGAFGQVNFQPPSQFLGALNVPCLFCWNSNDDRGQVGADMTEDGRWDLVVARPKHGVVFPNARHGDYLSPNTTSSCSQSLQPGDCRRVPGLTSDFVTTFMAKYMPPQYDFGAFTWVPDSLFVRPQDLPPPPANGFYAGGFLSSFAASQQSSSQPSKTCVESVRWQTASASGSLSLGSS